MTFLLLKVLEVLVMPVGLATLALLLALLLSWRRPWSARLLLLAALALIGGLGSLGVAQRLIAPLETAYPEPPATVRADAAVVLTGTVDLARSTPERVELYAAPERLLEGLDLLRTGRAGRLVLVGGSGDPDHPEASEARLLAALARRLGAAPDRILVAPASRTTRENAVEAADLLKKEGIGSFFLVTSAAHLPRAVGCFRQVGLDPIPYPVDYRGVPVEEGWRTWLPVASGLSLATMALHEYLGYGLYWALGYL